MRYLPTHMEPQASDRPPHPGVDLDRDEARRRIAAHPFWYHTIDLAPGVTTPGWFDLRHVVDDLPWPDVRGKRCLDVGTFDGFFAFELERRGAAEVVAVDIEDHARWDWPADARPGPLGTVDGGRMAAFTGPPKGDGFRLLASLTGSSVLWRGLSVYDLAPGQLGTFDVVVMGSLLIHLRDPVAALEAVRSVCRGQLLSSDQIELWLSIVGKGRPLARLHGSGQDCQWWRFNAAGHQRLLWSAGFEVDQASRPFIVRFNAHPRPRWTAGHGAGRVAARALTGDHHAGVLHRALLAHPRLGCPAEHA